MNVALPALIVFLLVLPGFIARSQIKLAEREKLDYCHPAARCHRGDVVRPAPDNPMATGSRRFPAGLAASIPPRPLVLPPQWRGLLQG